jgi:uncharacterized protein YfeS
MKKKLLLFLTFPFVLAFLAQPIRACTCNARSPVFEAYKRAEAVFVGKVTGSKDIEHNERNEDEDEEYFYKERIYQFQVAEAFKGIKGKQVEISAGSVNSSCYSGFSVGESYLVYAYADDEGNLSHSSCSLTENLIAAQDQIYFIRELLKGKSEPQIYGSVQRGDTDAQTGNRRTTYLPGIKIVVEASGGKTFETVTDKNGIFRFNKIPPGDYKISAATPEKYRTYLSDTERLKILPSKKISVENSLGITHNFDAFFVEFALGWNNQVKGKVYDAEGSEIKFAAVRLLPAVNPFRAIVSDSIMDKLDDGEYLCSDETPGRYYLVAEIYAPFGEKDKVRIFYPQSETPEKASVINLKATDKLTFDFIFPAKYLIREISGQVAWSDGQPAQRAKVLLAKTENYPVDEEGNEDEDAGYAWIFTDENGNFVLHGFENAEYWLHASDEYTPDGEDGGAEIAVKSKPLKIKVEKTNEPLKLILAKP